MKRLIAIMLFVLSALIMGTLGSSAEETSNILPRGVSSAITTVIAQG